MFTCLLDCKTERRNRTASEADKWLNLFMRTRCGSPSIKGYNILFHVLTFAKPECDNVLQPEPRRLQHIITRGLGKR